MTPFVENLLLQIGDLPLALVFLFFFLSGLLQIVFPPYPGDTVLVFGGCLGGLNLPITGFVALAGYLSATIVTSILLYELGYRLRDKIYAIPIIAKIVQLEKREQIERAFKKHGVGLLVVCKFIPGVNTLVILLGGVLRYPRVKGISAIALSSVVHNCLFFYVGHLLGSNLDAINYFLRRYTLFAGIIAGLAAVAIIIWYFVNKRKKESAK